MLRLVTLPRHRPKDIAMRVLPLIFLLLPFAAFAQAPVALNVVGIFEEYDERGDKVVLGPSVNVSGAVCIKNGLCFAVADEGRFAQAFELNSDRMVIGQRLYLTETKDKPKKELKDFDLEGLAATGDTLIAIGSHSRGRRSCKSPDRSLRIFWGEVDEAMIGTRQPLTERSRSLEPLFARFDELAQAFNQPLQENGLNIEAVAAKGSSIFIGFRAPFSGVDSPRVLIAEMTLKAIKDRDFSDARLHRVAIEGPPGRGVRGMEVMGDDLILLIGDAGVGAGKKDECDKPSPHRTGAFSLHRWALGNETATPVMNLDLPDKDWKAEGVLPLDDTSVLVFFDGPPNGAPHIYTFP